MRLMQFPSESFHLFKWRIFRKIGFDAIPWPKAVKGGDSAVIAASSSFNVGCKSEMPAKSKPNV